VAACLSLYHATVRPSSDLTPGMANFLISTAGGTISGSTTNDLIEFITGGSASTVRGYDGDDTVRASAGYSLNGITFFANTGNDIVDGSGADLIDSNLQLGRGNDSAEFGGTTEDVASSTVKGKAGNDSLTLVDDSGTASSLALLGNAGDDTIGVRLSGTLMDGNTTVAGGAGGDTINLNQSLVASSITVRGGLGEDTVNLSGGTLADSTLLLKSNTKDQSLDSANTLNVVGQTINTSSIVGGGAVDTITVSGGAMSEVTLRAGAGADVFTISGAASQFQSSIFNLQGGDDIFTGGGGISGSTIDGGAGDDDLTIISGGNSIIGGLGADNVSALATGGYGYLTGNSFFYNTSTESTIDSMDTIDLMGANFSLNSANDVAAASGLTFQFDTSFGNVSAVSGTTLTTGLAVGLSTSIAINSGVAIFSGGDFDNAANASVTSIATLLDAGITQAGDSVLFTNTGVGGDVYLFVEKGDNDLVVTMDNATGALAVSAAGGVSGAVLGLDLVATNSNTSITLTIG